MFQAFLIKYGEIGVKGKNRYVFEDALVKRIKEVLRPVDGHFQVTKDQGRIYVEAVGAFDYEEAVSALRRVFGIVSICPVVILEDCGLEALTQDVLDYVGKLYAGQKKTFKVHTRRANKKYPVESMAVNAEIGGKSLGGLPELSGGVDPPGIMLCI